MTPLERPGLALALLAVVTAAGATAPTNELDPLIDLWNQGRVESAREGLHVLLAAELETLEELVERAPARAEGRRQRLLRGARSPEVKAEVRARLSEEVVRSWAADEIASQLGWVMTILRAWQAEEVRFAVDKGGTTPQSVYTDVADCGRRLERALTRLEGLAVGISRWPAHSRRSFVGIREDVAEALSRTVVFLAGSNNTEERDQLLALAAKRKPMLPTLKDVDQRSYDLRKLFRLGPPPSATFKAPAPDEVFLPVDRAADAALYDLLETYYARLFAGDLEGVRALLLPEAFAEEELLEDMKEFAGWRLESVAEVVWRDLGDGRLVVRARRLNLIDRDGTAVEGRKELVVRRIDGAYRIEKR